MIGRRIDKTCIFIVSHDARPCVPAVRRASGTFAQIDHVIKRIVDLTAGEGRRDQSVKRELLSRIMVQHSAPEAGHIDLIAMSQNHRCDLRVEQRQGKLSHFLDEDLQILMCGVEHLGDGGVGQKVPQGRKFDSRGQRVDGGGGGSITDLDQAELRVVGLLAHEFGVDGKERRASQLRYQRLEPGSLWRQHLWLAWDRVVVRDGGFVP